MANKHIKSNLVVDGTIQSTNSANWDAAYGWGNHASAGYLTAIADGSVTRNKLATALKGYTNLGNVSGTVNIDCSLGVHFKLNMTGAITSLTFSNYSTEQFKTITLEITGNYALTQPTTVKGDWTDFDGTKTNQIQIYLFDVTTPVFSSALMNW